MNSSLNLLLQEYAHLHQLQASEFDNNKSASIQFEQDIEVHCQLNQEEDLITFYTYVSLIEQDIDQKTLLFMLQANHFGTLTRGHTLSMSPNSNHLMLHNLMPTPGMNQESFSWYIEQLAAATREWRNFLQAPEEAQPESANETFNFLQRV
ncbi:type III secretion system chaperone [Thalassomonas haliotis]|uniref:Type III secretion system chaperone n=1 Tax=Thalassomonas haliotis TaxID=485448 RepID=A0ABY7VEG6_9GAMM|nr:type III secretion system chaperone [Thalassomonas haliotis]WDE12092.1 type III secretion system chaperone [Thalassomonas haliotis]